MNLKTEKKMIKALWLLVEGTSNLMEHVVIILSNDTWNNKKLRRSRWEKHFVITTLKLNWTTTKTFKVCCENKIN